MKRKIKLEITNAISNIVITLPREITKDYVDDVKLGVSAVLLASEDKFCIEVHKSVIAPMKTDGYTRETLREFLLCIKFFIANK